MGRKKKAKKTQYRVKARVGRKIKTHTVNTKAEAKKIVKNLNSSGLGFKASWKKV